MWGLGLDSTDLGWGPVENSCEQMFYKMQGTFFPAEQLSASEEGLCCLEIVRALSVPREFLWEWSGHERLSCTLSENMRPPCNTSYTQCTVPLRLLEYNVFGIGIGGVRMSSKIIPSSAPTFQRTSRGAGTIQDVSEKVGAVLGVNYPAQK
jgi:hypothetical protein